MYGMGLFGAYMGIGHMEWSQQAATQLLVQADHLQPCNLDSAKMFLLSSAGPGGRAETQSLPHSLSLYIYIFVYIMCVCVIESRWHRP